MSTGTLYNVTSITNIISSLDKLNKFHIIICWILTCKVFNTNNLMLQYKDIIDNNKSLDRILVYL